jgi:hypothetical protein
LLSKKNRVGRAVRAFLIMLLLFGAHGMPTNEE